MSYFEEQERQRRDEPDDPGSAAAHHHREAMRSHWDDDARQPMVELAEVVKLRDEVRRLRDFAEFLRVDDALDFALDRLDLMIAAAGGEEE